MENYASVRFYRHLDISPHWCARNVASKRVGLQFAETEANSDAFWGGFMDLFLHVPVSAHMFIVMRAEWLEFVSTAMQAEHLRHNGQTSGSRRASEVRKAHLKRFASYTMNSQ